MMSGFGPKLVARWNDWQLIGAVLLSLLVQLLLLGTAGVRRRTKPRMRSKIYFWALHVGSRYIITYPLGILSRASTDDPNAAIQAFWAALLLFHLGRPDDFTALSLEDNLIWHRQGFELFVQALITAYIFSRYCVDQDFKRLIVPFALISLAGSLKCIEQVFALKQATMEALVKSVLGTADAGPDYADTMDRVDGMLRSGILPYIKIDSKHLPQPNSGVPEAGETRANQNIEAQLGVDGSVADAPEADRNIEQQLAMNTNAVHPREAVNIVTSAYSLFKTFKVLFADGIFSFEHRRESQALFLGKDAKWAFKVIEIELSFVYDRLYTKASVSRTKTGMMIRLASLLLTLAASVYTIFATIYATQYRLRHRCVTYTLLAGAVFTEAAILARYSYSIWSLAMGSDSLEGWSLVGRDSLKRWSVNLLGRSRWSGYMAQSNLILFCLQKLPSDSRLEKLFADYSSGGWRGHATVSALPFRSGIISSAIEHLLRWLAGRLSTPAGRVAVLQPAGDEAVRLAVWQYLQRPSVLEQLQSKRFWNRYKKTRYIRVQEKLKAFIYDQVKEKECIINQEEQQKVCREREEENWATGTPVGHRKPFIDCKGDWVLEKENVDESLGWTFQGKDFDESLLLWHIATDLCFRQEEYPGENGTATEQPASLQVHSDSGKDLRFEKNDSGKDSTDQVILEVNPDNNSLEQQVEDHKDIGTEISNYLLYIMVVHPLMLSSSTTMSTKRCRDTCAEARRHFLKKHIQTFSSKHAINETNAHTSLLEVETTVRASAVKGDKSKSVLWDGCFLAKQLKTLDRRDRWRVISKVWVEMLCYAAVQCGGYQHAERLKEGGELITFVCLLMTHLGMGKHYRTEVGDAYAHLSAFTAQSASRPAPTAQAQGVQQNATVPAAGEATTSGHGQQAATTSIDEASTSGHGHQ